MCACDVPIETTVRGAGPDARDFGAPTPEPASAQVGA